ncbi:MAG: sigma-70 family RNA polymerase sigma factor [Armatimonadota bacterium]|nr:MAG: sigma-70 family RNA polymerase sigma factor [Armatimonadota bacterium]
MTGISQPETDSVQHLFRRYGESKDLRLRDEIVAQHMYVVQAVAKKFVGMGEPYEDLVQEGTMGLLNAVDMYDVRRGIKFSTYATHLVTGHIRHCLRDRGRIIRQPAWVQELSGKITKAADALRHKLKRDPTVDEIAERLSMTPEGVQEILNARDRSKVASLDAPSGSDDEYAGPTVDVDKIRTSRHSTLHLPVEDKIVLQEATQKLKDLERKVVRYFFYHDLNQTEIARRMGISVNYASYLLRGALNKLRATFEAHAKALEATAETETAPRPAAEPALGPADPATGLACAPYFEERVRQEIERARRYPQTFAVLILEAPERAAEAEASAQLANLLRRSIRQVDVLARHTRTAFALLLPQTGREARVLGERLVQAIPAAAASSQERADGDLRLVAGFAVYPSDGRTAEQLIEGARRAVKQALEAGGGAVERAPRGARQR